MSKLYRVLMTSLLLAGPVLAQQYEVPPPKTSSADPSMLWPWVYGLVFLLGCLAVAFKPARRANLQ